MYTGSRCKPAFDELIMDRVSNMSRLSNSATRAAPPNAGVTVETKAVQAIADPTEKRF